MDLYGEIIPDIKDVEGSFRLPANCLLQLFYSNILSQFRIDQVVFSK